MACASVELIVRRELVKRLFHAAKTKLSVSTSGIIDIFYEDEQFLEFVREALLILKEQDALNYSRVQKHVRGIIQSPVNEYWAGRAIGVYFDSAAERARFTRQPARYAARLVRFATESRILSSYRIVDILRNRGVRYDRTIQISVSRELRCCERIGCPIRDIYELRRSLDRPLWGCESPTDQI